MIQESYIIDPSRPNSVSYHLFFLPQFKSVKSALMMPWTQAGEIVGCH